MASGRWTTPVVVGPNGWTRVELRVDD
jgi:hypothetical protein